MRGDIIVPSHLLWASIDPEGDPERYLLPVSQNVFFLLVDDQPDLLDAYCLMLTAEGYGVCCSHNVGEALEHALRQQPDLIITD
ncbi:response regulator [Paraburkholderia oxyphila]|uniref:response regulator n=1 Tax=Paraburkholderia oxyphila TaxID=614212 RepID=UPI0005B8D0C3|nr:response regulator [Paraburkholderia oxyphila]